MLARLNSFGERSGTVHPRLGRRKYDTHPLVVGEALCSRQDCIIYLEKRETISSRKVTSGTTRGDRLFCAVSVGGGDGAYIKKPAGKYGRYRTSTASIIVLVEALEQQGVHIGQPYPSSLSSLICLPLGFQITTVADICGTPIDRICQYFSSRVGVRCAANDLHPTFQHRQMLSGGHGLAKGAGDQEVACTESDNGAASMLFTQLDAASASFVSDFLASYPQGSSCNSLYDFIITSPPYEFAVPIIRNALSMAKVLVAMKLSLHFLCPGPTCLDRRQFLKQYPPSSIIPLSRSDNHEFYHLPIDEAWFIWIIPSSPIHDNCNGLCSRSHIQAPLTLTPFTFHYT
jgi:hypothetical protein